MRYQISGKQIDIGMSLQTHVRTELDEVVQKYAERPTDALVVFSKSAHEFACETTVHLSTGLIATAKAKDTEIYAAFNSCCAKMEKQLRRYKRRLKDHQKDRTQPVNFSVVPPISSLQKMVLSSRNLKHCNPLSWQRWKQKSHPFPLVRRSCRWNWPEHPYWFSATRIKMG